MRDILFALPFFAVPVGFLISAIIDKMREVEAQEALWHRREERLFGLLDGSFD